MEEYKYQITMLYIATFGRAPDASGLNYWVYDSNLDIEEIAQSFFDQSETQELYPEGISIDSFIYSVYNNLFDRDPDMEGFEYWKDELESGRVSKSHFILALINGALGDDAVLLENKTDVGLAFVDYDLEDIQIAHDIMEGITIDEKSVEKSLDLLKNMSDYTSVQEAYINFSHIDNDLGELSNFNTYGVEELYSGYYWDVGLDNEITYSFNTTLPEEYGEQDSQNWEELNDNQKDAVRDIMDNLSNLLGVDFVETEADSGMIRFNVIEMDDEWAGYAYYPGDYNRDGDVFLSQIFNTDETYFDLSPGSIGWSSIAHEIGHALGLKHPFDGYPTLPKYLDDKNHTIMSYTNKNDIVPVFTLEADGLRVDYDAIMPQLYSLYDIEALQAIYGVNDDTNDENSTYTIHYTDYQIYTIWDSGGTDTIDLSDNSGHDIIDMSDGSINSADYYSLEEIVDFYQSEIDDSYYDTWIEDKIEELYYDKQLYDGTNNLSIATGTIIENLYTGSNSDIVRDNEVNNTIITNSGDDKIYLGDGGYDIVDGGEGYDIVFLDLATDDINVDMLEDSSYLIVSENFAAQIKNIEEIYFSPENAGYNPDDLLIV